MNAQADESIYQSEYELEKEMVSQLARQGWQRVSIKDSDDLEANFRAQFNQHNKKALNGIDLSDAEFRRVMAHLRGRGVFESAKLIRDSQNLLRDDNSTLTYSLLNTKEWCKNTFQVSTQVNTRGDRWDNRYDVTLLVNGLPLIQIELKRRGTEMAKAFSQICRYQQDNAYNGLFSFIQFFIVSNGVNTKYFANSESQFNSSFAFHWTKEDNSRYSNLADFTTDFLDPCWATKMISRYMVIQEADKRIIILRPYQVYGVERMVSAAIETGNNGFIWHTTGSGKTLTSFTVSRLLKDLGKFSKVFFLVDRRDLNKQTYDEFNQFQPGSVSNSENTRELVSSIASDRVEDKLILTTIQKMDKALKHPRHAKVMDSLKDEPVVFIIDECHRSQFGDMQKSIRQHFTKAQYFGFTGTPRLPENRSMDGRTTADIFGNCLHTYLLKNSIADGNTLPFSVEYASTVEAKDDISDGERKVSNIITDEVWKDPQRIRLVVDDIIADRERKSRRGKFNAMLTVDSVKSAILYMEALKTASAGLEESKRLTVATVYSYDANEALDVGQEHARGALERFIGEYNEVFDTNHSTSEAARYNSDVADRFKKNEIDLLVVVDMMLTGFDSPILNTLYVDRTFEHHSLIQAYSRTNRVHGKDKGAGYIKCYRDLKTATDEAVRLFSNVENVNEVLALPYTDQKKAYESALRRLQEVVSEPEDVAALESETEKREFVLAFRDFIREYRKIDTFAEFDHADFDISRQQIEDFRSHYLDINNEAHSDGNEASVLNDIDFRLEEVLVDVINVDYIFRLLGEIDHTDAGERKKLREMVSKDGTQKLRTKRELLLDFIDTVMPTIPEGGSVQGRYIDYLDEKVLEDVKAESESLGLTPGILLEILREYRFRGKIDVSKFNQHTTLTFLGKTRSLKRLKELILSLSEMLEMEE